MKLIEDNTRHDPGYITLIAEDSEDMYNLYNLIAKDDYLTTSTVRNVVVREKANGQALKERIAMKLKLAIESIEFDSETCSLRVKGKNCEENEYVKKGQYHTLEIELNRQFTLEKLIWDSMHIEILQKACDPKKGSEMAAVVMQEGLAHVCLITALMTQTLAKIEKKLGKKGGIAKSNSYDSSRNSFFTEIYESMKNRIDWDIMKVVIIGGLDVTRTDFIAYLKRNCESLQDHHIIRNQKKILQVHASSGHKNAIDEILSKEEIQNKLTDMKAASEVKALQRFKKKLANQPDYTSYGYNHVQYADTLSLIDELLIIDSLFQNADFHKRRQYITLIDSVREKNGSVFLFSKLHESGHQLDLYSGIAAVLRAPLVEYENHIESVISNNINVFRVPSYSNDNSFDVNDDNNNNDGLDESTLEAMRSMGLIL